MNSIHANKIKTSRFIKHHDGFRKYDVSGRGGLALLFVIVLYACLDINNTYASF